MAKSTSWGPHDFRSIKAVYRPLLYVVEKGGEGLKKGVLKRRSQGGNRSLCGARVRLVPWILRDKKQKKKRMPKVVWDRLQASKVFDLMISRSPVLASGGDSARIG